MRVEGKGRDTKIYMKCFICESEYRYGPHVYDGRAIPRYNFAVCRTCYSSNWDGWVPHAEPKIIKHLEHENLPIPERNDKGWLPRD